MVKSFFSQSVNRAKSSLTETVEVQPEEREEIREADERAEQAQQAVHPTPQPTAPQPTSVEQQPTPIPTPAAAPAQAPAVSPAQPVDALFADTTRQQTTPQTTGQETAPQTPTPTTPAPGAAEPPAQAAASTEVEAHEAVETTVMPAILNYKPEQSRGNIELKNGAILRKVTFRMTPDNIVLVKTVAAQRNIPVQAVLNALVEEGLKQGRCDLHTAEQFLQYHKA